jgi:hypothetical protein
LDLTLDAFETLNAMWAIEMDQPQIDLWGGGVILLGSQFCLNMIGGALLKDQDI